MQTTGIFTLHSHKIIFEKYNEPIPLIPFGDVHRSAPLCHEEKWLEFLEWAKTKKNAYFLGMGDYDDLASASEREILATKKLHESTKETLDSIYRKYTQRFVKEISFMKGRLIGLLEGNHYAELQSGITTTQYMAELLGTKYLGVSTFLRLSFEATTRGRRGNVVDIWAHHGKGAARLSGSSLNTVEQMAEAAEADIYLMGHDHRKGAIPTVRLRLTEGAGCLRLSHRKLMLVRTGSFLKGYVPDKSSYIADRALKPTDIGVTKIELTPRREQKDKSDFTYIDIHASV